MILKQLYMGVLCCAVLNGCASGAASPAPAMEAQARTDVLAPRVLLPGECGLFVWTSAAPRRFILFSQARSGKANWQHEGREQTLEIASVSGGEVFGQYPQQQYTSETGDIITLDLRKPEPYGDSLRYNEGILSYSADTAGDWKTVTPVVGLASCKSST